MSEQIERHVDRVEAIAIETIPEKLNGENAVRPSSGHSSVIVSLKDSNQSLLKRELQKFIEGGYVVCCVKHHMAFFAPIGETTRTVTHTVPTFANAATTEFTHER